MQFNVKFSISRVTEGTDITSASRISVLASGVCGYLQDVREKNMHSMKTATAGQDQNYSFKLIAPLKASFSPETEMFTNLIATSANPGVYITITHKRVPKVKSWKLLATEAEKAKFIVARIAPNNLDETEVIMYLKDRSAKN